MKRRIGWAGGLLALVAYFSTGLTLVAPGEVVSVRRFGRLVEPPWGPGLHFGGPWGVDRPTRVRAFEVRRMVVGLSDAPDGRDEPGAGEFLTGDLNLLHAGASVQYRVADPSAYALNAPSTEPLLRRLAASCLSRALARRGVDEALHEGRSLVARDVQNALNAEASRYGLGLQILGVSLTEVRPPSEVAAEFSAAQSAGSDYRRRLQEAATAAETTATAARSEANRRADLAAAQADRTRVAAQAQAERFRLLLAEVGPSRSLTLHRLYRDTLRDLLSKVGRTVILAPEEPVDLSLYGPGR